MKIILKMNEATVVCSLFIILVHIIHSFQLNHLKGNRLVSFSSLDDSISSNSLFLKSVDKNSQLTVLIPSNTSETGLSDFLVKPSYEKVSWYDVFSHLSERLQWENVNYPTNKILSMQIYQTDEITSNNLVPSDIFLLIGLKNISIETSFVLDQIYSNTKYKAIIPFNCSTEITDKYIRFGDKENNENIPNFIDDIMNFYNRIINKEYYQQLDQLINVKTIVKDLWIRKSSDDLLFMILVLIDLFSDCDIKSVKSVTSTSNTGFEELKCMCKNCAKQMFDCFTDENCRKALDCLSNCKGNDQVCSYRCITSYESEKFQEFAFCILQKNNCMNYKAIAPRYPDPLPLKTFRGKSLTFDVADDIFIGHLNTLPTRSTNLKNLSLLTQSSLIENINSYDYQPWSWMVVCGQNPAYDFFANQHQLFYKELVKRNNESSYRPVFWYDPVFKVTTLNNNEVWRRRHYRVRRGKIPGQFYFHVLDNGVASNEFWRILDCDDNLDWAVFYYCGAASNAGTAYKGALVVSKDGKWPKMTDETKDRIYSALNKGGVKSWELFEVHNEKNYNISGLPPLDV